MKATERLQLSREARKLAGKVSALVCCQTNGIEVETVRSICCECYVLIDALLEMVGRFEGELGQNAEEGDKEP